MQSKTNVESPYKLTIKELKQLIKNAPDETEVRISSIYHKPSGLLYHTSISAALFDCDNGNSFFVLEPYELKVEETY